MATAGYMKISGESQGAITGSTSKVNHESDIEIFTFDHAVEVPASPDKQVVVGSVIHRPIVITKEVDRSTPCLFQSLCLREVLDDVEMLWFRHNSQGKEELIYRIFLSKARIKSIVPWTPSVLSEDKESYRFMEKVTLVYEKISWSWGASGDTEFETDWYAK